MALIVKGNPESLPKPEHSEDVKVVRKSQDFLTLEEVDFVIEKLQQANYKGVEFERYYKVTKKLLELKDFFR